MSQSAEKILSEERKCCFTGYRPSKFPFSLDKENRQFKLFEDCLINGILELAKENCHTFYTGMAMGFDIIAAETVIYLKKIYKTPIKLISVIPFRNQEDSYTTYWKERYQKVLDNCDEVITLSENYFQGCYQKRNIYMVENSDYVLTWYDGKSGGTRNTIDYAAKIGRQIININPDKVENFAVQTYFEVV